MSIVDLITADLNRQRAVQERQAATAEFTAQTGRIGVNASANLDNTRAGLLPAESAAEVALRRSQARLTGVQADVLPRMTAAQIGSLNADAGLARANTGLVGANTDIARRSLREFTVGDDDVLGVTRQRLGGSLYQLPSIIPGR